MTKLTGYNLGPPFKGMATQIDPVVAASQGYLADAVNVTYDEVTAKPMPMAMQEVAQGYFPYRFIFFHYGFGWINKAGLEYGLRGSRSKDGRTVSYITDPSSVPTGRPLKYYGQAAAPVTMGLDAPAAAPVPVPGARGNIVAAYTYINYNIAGDDLIESNPSPKTAAFKDGGSISIVWPASSRVTAVNIYATLDNDASGTLFYVGYLEKTGSPAGTSFSLSAYSRDLGRALNWGPGGSLESDVDVFFDHSPPGRVTCFSDKFHGTEASSDDNAGGTLFYAEDNVVGWTETGEPEYFPTFNKYLLQGTVRALISSGTQTYAFTEDQIWAFSGQVSSAMTARQVVTGRGILEGREKSVQSTPYGIVYCSREGLCLFDGNNSKLICQEVFREFSPQPASNNANYYTVSAYIDGIYYLCIGPEYYDSYKTWKIDLRQETPIATRCSFRFFASHKMNTEVAGPSNAAINSATTWAAGITYASGDAPYFVQVNNTGQQFGARYLSRLGSNTNNHPILRSDYWWQIPDGLTYLALIAYEKSDLSIRSSGGLPPVWSSTQTYKQTNLVYYNQKVWQSTADPNTNNIPSTPFSAYWSEYNPYTLGNTQSYSICPYSEDPTINSHASLPMTIQTHPLRLGPINSFNKLRRARVDGVGDATVTISFNAEAGRTYARPVTVSNNSTSRFMLPMSLYGDSFTIKVESTTSFALRQVELEGSTNR